MSQAAFRILVEQIFSLPEDAALRQQEQTQQKRREMER